MNPETRTIPHGGWWVDGGGKVLTDGRCRFRVTLGTARRLADYLNSKIREQSDKRTHDSSGLYCEECGEWHPGPCDDWPSEPPPWKHDVRFVWTINPGTGQVRVEAESLADLRSAFEDIQRHYIEP